MIFVTKFNPNDEVWIMKLNKPTKIRIENVQCSASICGRFVNVYEYQDYCGHYARIYETDMFATKQELIDSL